MWRTIITLILYLGITAFQTAFLNTTKNRDTHITPFMNTFSAICCTNTYKTFIQREAEQHYLHPISQMVHTQHGKTQSNPHSSQTTTSNTQGKNGKKIQKAQNKEAQAKEKNKMERAKIASNISQLCPNPGASQLRIVQININSLNQANMSVLLHTLEAMKADICLITETKLAPTSPAWFLPRTKQWQYKRLDRETDKSSTNRRGGIAILHRSYIQAKLQDSVQGDTTWGTWLLSAKA
jgi:hypothetical protein